MSKHLTRRTILKTGTAAGAVFAIPSLATHVAAQDATPVPGGTFVYGTSPLPWPAVHPLGSLSTTQWTVIHPLFLRLVYGQNWGDGVNPDFAPTFDMGVAESATEIEVNRVWEFKLRTDVTWHDGAPVTADDVIFGVWLALNKDAGSTGNAALRPILGADALMDEGAGQMEPPYEVSVEGVTKIDDTTIRFELKQPTANFWVDTNVSIWPMPKHILGEQPITALMSEPYVSRPIGNGPFMVSDFVEGQYYELAAYENFHLGRPLLDRVIIRFGDGDTLTAAVESGEIHGTISQAGPIFDRLTGLDGLVGNVVPRTLPVGFAVNAERWPNEAATLNRAIMYGIDVPTLNEQLYSSTLNPSNYLFEHIIGYETAPEGFPTYEYDPAKAQELLAEISWDSSKVLEWIIWSTPGPAEDAMQAMLASIGINTEFKVIDAAAVVPELYQAGNFDIVFANFQGSQDMNFMWVNIGCEKLYDQGGFNYARYCNEELDALWAQGLEAVVPEERKAIFDDVSLMIAEQPPQATLWRPSITYIYSDRVRGAFPFQDFYPVRAPWERIWMAPEE
jgi:peptide/nickel transport system substrate-binding protein